MPHVPTASLPASLFTVPFLSCWLSTKCSREAHVYLRAEHQGPCQGLCLEYLKALSLPGSRRSFLTNIVLSPRGHLLAPESHQACLGWHLLALCPPGNYSTKTQCIRIQRDASDFPRGKHFLISTYLFNNYYIPALEAVLPQEMKTLDQHVSIFSPLQHS